MAHFDSVFGSPGAADDASRTRQMAQAVSDEDLFDFYNSVIPNTVTSVADLAKWWKSKHDEQPDLLDFDPENMNYELLNDLILFLVILLLYVPLNILYPLLK